MREFIRGDEWDADCCNTRESFLRTTTPIGIYPDGVSPYGCLDMAGNVWEWTRPGTKIIHISQQMVVRISRAMMSGGRYGAGLGTTIQAAHAVRFAPALPLTFVAPASAFVAVCPRLLTRMEGVKE